MSKRVFVPTLVSVILVAAAAVGSGAAGRVRPSRWTSIPADALTVTQGALSPSGPRNALRTADPGMRAVHDDDGSHAASARLSFRYLGESVVTVPLGSGAIRRQIGLKLAAADPCNLVYVMWRAYPDRALHVQVKRNPGQSTSAQCGNNGYTTIADIPLGPGDGTSDPSGHKLDVRTTRDAAGALVLMVRADGAPPREITLPAELTRDLDGPIGVRSDNGTYVFRLSGGR